MEKVSGWNGTAACFPWIYDDFLRPPVRSTARASARGVVRRSWGLGRRLTARGSTRLGRWGIDPAPIPLFTGGVDTTFILPTLTPTGSASVPFCSQYLFALTQGDVNANSISLVGPANPNRIYVLHWTFEFAANVDPLVTTPGDFRDPTDQYMDDAKFRAFRNALITYKLINRFQLRYRATGETFNGAPVVLQRLAAIGWTVEPCGSGVALIGQGGANNGLIDSTPQSMWHINDGSPDASGILVANTLMGNAVPTNPLFWENIGSRIRFRATGGTEPDVDVQVFPTYYEYHNGRLMVID